MNSKLRPDIASLIPPAWTGAAEANHKESAAAKLRREKLAPVWALVPTIPDQETRKKLLKKHAFRVDAKGKGADSSVTMPSTLDMKEVDTLLSKRKDPQSVALLRLLKTDLPAVVSRESDVFRSLLTQVNSWSTRSNEQNLARILEVIIPLVIDNNMRTTEAMLRVVGKLVFPNGKLPDPSGPSTTVPLTETPLMQQMLAKFGEKADFDKTIQKGNTRSSGTSSNTFKSYSRGTGDNRNPSSNRSRGGFHTRSRGRGGFSNFRRGGNNNRNYGDRPSSSSHGKGGSSSRPSASSSNAKDKSSF